MTFAVFKVALMSAVRTSTMITFIIVGAAFLSQVVGFLGITTAVTDSSPNSTSRPTC